MQGRPVWLASVSRWQGGQIVPTPAWPDEWVGESEKLLRHALAGAGDESRERLFRMNITLCLHRGLSDEEEELIGPGCAVHLAGGPIEVLWQKGVESSPAAMPCVSPLRDYFSNEPHHWLPVDCGICEPCLARLAIEEAA